MATSVSVWRTMLGREQPPGSDGNAVVWVVRRDWPDRSHEFIRPCRNRAAALRQLAADRRFWRPGPLRPQLSIVEISRREFWLHGRYRRDCRAPDCPMARPVPVWHGVMW